MSREIQDVGRDPILDLIVEAIPVPVVVMDREEHPFLGFAREFEKRLEPILLETEAALGCNRFVFDFVVFRG